MVLTAFPFDQQSCTLRFGSWSYQGSLLNLNIPSEDEDQAWDIHSQYHENGEWHLASAKVHRVIKEYSSSVTNGLTSNNTILWPELYFSLTLQRKYNFYLCTLLIPYLSTVEFGVFPST